MATADEYRIFKMRKAIKFGLLSGTIAGVLTFLFCYWAASQPVVTEVSTSWSFRPWWRAGNWISALFALLFFGIGLGILAGLRPKMRKTCKRSALPRNAE